MPGTPSASAARCIGLDVGFHRGAVAADRRGVSIWTLGIEVSATRRFRDGGPASYAVVANPPLNWQVTPQWSFPAEIDGTRRWYERYLGRERRDLTGTAVVTLEFQPPEGWLPARGTGWRRALGARR